MKFYINDIKSNLKDSPSSDEISDKLFQLGHENEINEDIIDIDFTPNRGDCLSVKGVSRDLSVFFGSDINEDLFNGDIDKLSIDFTNNITDFCPSISFLKIEAKNFSKNYKNYLEEYFTKLEVKKNNFFTDISNYLSYETGQPTHCYDFQKIKGKISLDYLSEEIDFQTLVGKKIKLQTGDPVFFLDNKVINLAGIMGGDQTSCDLQTKSVLVECAYFNPETIIGKALKYDIHSDASYKFERGVDILNQEKVLRRYIKIVQDHAEITNLQIVKKNYVDFKENNLKFDLNKINNILGTKISENDYQDILKKLGFDCFDGEITVPSHRSDIFHQNDLAEEVARVIGYNNIASSKVNIFKKNSTYKNKTEENIKSHLINNGFYESINFPFTINNSEDQGIKSINVDNPLDSNKNFLRTSLIPSLIENLLYNERKQMDSVKIFEISDVYFKDEHDNLQRKKLLAIIAAGRVANNFNDFSRKIDEKYISGILSQISNKELLNFKHISRNGLDTKSKSEIIAIELEISEINEYFESSSLESFRPENEIKYKKISSFPKSTRDISFSVEDTQSLKPLEDFITTFKCDILKEVFIFDYFENEKLNLTKIGFRFIFQDNNKTLTDEDVNDIMNVIFEKSLSYNGVSIPGLMK